MARNNRHIKEYEKEINQLRSEGKTHREIGEQLGFTKKQIAKFFERQNLKQRKIEAGIVIRPKGRQRNEGTEIPPSIQCLSKQSQLQYELAIKERHIKALEMENKLMRDFLSLTGRK